MKLKLNKNVKLSELTTFKVGGEAKYFISVKNKKKLIEAVSYAKKNELPIFVLGGGSDVLISDTGFKGVVIKLLNKKVTFKKANRNTVIVTASAGKDWDNFVRLCVKKNLQGIESLSGIPGTVGAAPIQNIGAYGQELKDTFINLTAYDTEKEKFIIINKKDCMFSYRESVFKIKKTKGRFIIYDVTLRLNLNKLPKVKYESLKKFLENNRIKNPNLMQVRNAVLALRKMKLEDPKNIANAGSYFKNPIVSRKIAENILRNYPDMPHFSEKNEKIKLYAAWLIEKAGWKGKRVGNVMVSEKNALVITNPEKKASSKEIREFAEKIVKEVRKKFKVKLKEEVQYIEK